MSKGILITGGTGAFGRAFVRYLLSPHAHAFYDRIIIYSRNEFQQNLMAKELADLDVTQSLRFFIGDVRDLSRFKRAIHGCSTVIHAAALKRIEVGHYNPDEMIKTNVGGAQNVVEACLDSTVKKVVFLSSDKAYQPISPYGLSKAMAESLFINANNMRGWGGPRLAVCRYGNVWKSRRKRGNRNRSRLHTLLHADG
jgi:UDP-N-acetylglucosamine 4,6-dehydratase